MSTSSNKNSYLTKVGCPTLPHNVSASIMGSIIDNWVYIFLFIKPWGG